VSPRAKDTQKKGHLPLPRPGRRVLLLVFLVGGVVVVFSSGASTAAALERVSESTSAPPEGHQGHGSRRGTALIHVRCTAVGNGVGITDGSPVGESVLTGVGLGVGKAAAV